MDNIIAKCACGTVTTIIGGVDTLWDRGNGREETKRFQMLGKVRCRSCKKYAPAGYIDTRKRGKRECGDWCTDGTGRKCTCVCEGRNHGSRYSHTGALWYAR